MPFQEGPYTDLHSSLIKRALLWINSVSLMPTGVQGWGYLVTRVSPGRAAGSSMDEDTGWERMISDLVTGFLEWGVRVGGDLRY